jgi:hypothetical protein
MPGDPLLPGQFSQHVVALFAHQNPHDGAAVCVASLRAVSCLPFALRTSSTTFEVTAPTRSVYGAWEW